MIYEIAAAIAPPEIRQRLISPLADAFQLASISERRGCESVASDASSSLETVPLVGFGFGFDFGCQRKSA